MKKLLIFFGCLLSVLTMQSKSEATYVSMEKEYSLTPDGAITCRVRSVLHYRTQTSFNSMKGETFVVYNPEYQSIKVDTSYTVQKDGTVLLTPSNAFNTALPSAAVYAPDYNNLLELIITHTGLEMGATAYLDYTLTTRPGFYPSLDVDEKIGEVGVDYNYYKVSVRIPSGTQLRWSLSGSNVKPTVKGELYTWVFKNVPAYRSEPFSIEGGAGMPRLSVTTSSGIEENLRPLSIETMDICRVPSKYMEGASEPLSKAKAIQRYVVGAWSLSAVSPLLTGYRARQCAALQETAYGTEVEKALAMAKLMRSEGLNAKAVAAFPSSLEVNTARTVAEYMVWCEGKLYSVHRMGVPELTRNSSYTICDFQGNVIALPTYSFDGSYKATIELEGDSTKAAVTLKGKMVLPVELFSEEKREQEGKQIAAKSGNVTGAVTTKSGEKGCEIDFSATSSVVMQEGYLLYALPSTGYGIEQWGIEKRLSEERVGDIELPYDVKENNEYNVIIKKGLLSKVPTKELKIKNSVGSLELSIRSEGETIRVTRSLSIPTKRIKKSQYKELRRLLLAWEDKNYRYLLFEQKSLH